MKFKISVILISLSDAGGFIPGNSVSSGMISCISPADNDKDKLLHLKGISVNQPQKFITLYGYLA